MRSRPRWWPALLLAVPALLAAATVGWVDLKPRVDERFFFTSDSAAYREERALHREFATEQLLVVTAYGPRLDNPMYQRRVAALTKRLGALPHVGAVRSLSSGPDDLKDALASPLWRRLLIAEGSPASHLVMVVDDRDNPRLVAGVQQVLDHFRAPDFRLDLAGVPYVVESISQYLTHDFAVFSAAAVLVFGVLVLALFRSGAILLGSLVACASAALLTLLLQKVFGGRIGLLTANLVTIAFVLTQSHVVFLTNNWQRLHAGGSPERIVLRALQRTLGASFWCMVAALLGFVSLLFVEAQPLRELGAGGTLATLSAIACAYLVFPPFLLWVRRDAVFRTRSLMPLPVLRVPRRAWAWLVLAGLLACGLGAAKLDTDPSLLEYFSRGSEVRASLERVDPHGGSSPLTLAVRRADGKTLDNEDSYRRLWRLQEALQADPAVGTVLSLPVLMAEADRSPLAKLLTWKRLLHLLEKPRYDRVARGFITPDHREGLFLLRMHETGRWQRRTEVLDRLDGIVRKHGFRRTLVGGIYALQGRLADLVTRSLAEGLAGLLAAFALIALIVTRSLTGAAAMLACAATVPAFVLGLFGLARVPLDVIATPGVNVAIGVAVDSMIHFGTAWRLARVGGAADPVARARAEQAGGMAAFSLVVVAGFSIFLFSSFPPTQRFGLSVLLGTLVAGAMALWVLPALLPARPVRRPDRTAADERLPLRPPSENRVANSPEARH